MTPTFRLVLERRKDFDELEAGKKMSSKKGIWNGVYMTVKAKVKILWWIHIL